MGGWSGTSKDLHPNELLHWTGIDWARSRGYRYYDFDDITLLAARAILAAEKLPPTASSLTRFKLRFGGDVMVFPAAHERCYPAALGAPFRLVRRYASEFRPLADRVLSRRARSSLNTAELLHGRAPEAGEWVILATTDNDGSYWIPRSEVGKLDLARPWKLS